MFAIPSGDGTHSRIAVASGAGGAVRALSDGRDFDECPTWSPDGDVLFDRLRSDAGQNTGSELHVVRPEGTGSEKPWHLPAGTVVAGVSFSPNGAWIALSTAGTNDLYVMRRDGTGRRKMSLGDCGQWWSPTEPVLAFTRSPCISRGD